MKQLLTKGSFVLWIKGECSPEEKEYWDSWVEEHPEHRHQVEEAKEIITAFESKYETPDPEVELDKLEKLIDSYENQQKQFKNNNYNGFYNYKRSRGSIAAGIIFLIVLLGSVYASWNYPSETEEPEIAKVTPIQKYNTEYGEKLTFRLSDGSRIILNGNSNLKFSSKIKNGLNTEVWLEGEAYFDIAHRNEEQQGTFTVHTEDGSIKVLGTHFSVNTFRDATRTVLKEGKISIRVSNETSDKSNEYKLETGEMAQFNANDNKITVRKVNTQVYTSWTEDKFIFEDTPLAEVARRIENTFGKEVLIDERLANETLSGSIKSDNLDVLIEALAEILDVSVREENQKLIIGS
jgi:ferric-dicitrate binding protein FerR (iron transport regulator)